MTDHRSTMLTLASEVEQRLGHAVTVSTEGAAIPIPGKARRPSAFEADMTAFASSKVLADGIIRTVYACVPNEKIAAGTIGIDELTELLA